jgi:hypothetical protein
VFLHLIADGGVLSFQAEGPTLTASFQVLLHLPMLLSALSIVRKVWAAVSRSVGSLSP